MNKKIKKQTECKEEESWALLNSSCPSCGHLLTEACFMSNVVCRCCQPLKVVIFIKRYFSNRVLGEMLSGISDPVNNIVHCLNSHHNLPISEESFWIERKTMLKARSNVKASSSIENNSLSKIDLSQPQHPFPTDPWTCEEGSGTKWDCQEAARFQGLLPVSSECLSENLDSLQLG